MSDGLVKRLRDRGVCSLAHNSCRNDIACEQAADRIEELDKRLNELIADKIELKSANIVLMRRLAKAVEALERIAGKVPYADDPWDIASLSLAELKGETDE